MSGLQMTLNICGNVHQVLFTKNTDVKYYGDTCDAMAAQLEDMMQAKKFIFLEYHAIEMAESFQALRKVFDGKGKRRRRNSYFV